MGVIFEAWDLPHDGGATNPAAMTLKIGEIPVTGYQFGTGLNEIGEGWIEVAATYDRLDEICKVDPTNHANDVGSQIRIRLENTTPGDEIYSFQAERRSTAYKTEDGAEVVRISGPGRENHIADAVVFPYDHPGPNGDGSLHLMRNWIYGGRNILENPGFEQSTEITTGTGDDVSGTGDFRPTGWDLSRDPQTGDIHGHIDSPTGQPEEDGFTVEDSSDGVTPDEGTYLGKINPLDVDTDDGRYSGIQQIVALKPGWTYTARIKAYSGATPTFGWRFVIRNLEEGILDGAEPPGVGSYEEKNLTPTSTWVLYGPVEFTVPADQEQAIFRMGLVTGTGNPTPVRFDSAELNEGVDAAKAGAIWQDLLNDAIVDHTANGRDQTLQFLKYDSFSATLDSSGASWVDDLSVVIRAGQGYEQVAQQFARLGFEWDLVWDNANTQYSFDLYEGGNLGTDRTTGVDHRRIVAGMGTESGDSVHRRPKASHALGIGKEGVSAEVEDATLKTAWGHRESVVLDADSIDTNSITEAATHAVNEYASRTTGQKLVMLDTAQVRPWADFQPGDTIEVLIPDDFPTPASLRVQRIRTYRGSDGNPRHSVEFSSETYESGMAALTAGVSRLFAKFDALPDNEARSALASSGASVVAVSADVGIPTYFMAAVDSAPRDIQLADVVGDGIDDQTHAQALVDLAVADGVTSARFVFAPGTYTFDASDAAPVALGQLTDSVVVDCWGAEFIADGDGNTFFELNNGSTEPGPSWLWVNGGLFGDDNFSHTLLNDPSGTVGSTKDRWVYLAGIHAEGVTIYNGADGDIDAFIHVTNCRFLDEPAGTDHILFDLAGSGTASSLYCSSSVFRAGGGLADANGIVEAHGAQHLTFVGCRLIGSITVRDQAELAVLGCVVESGYIHSVSPTSATATQHINITGNLFSAAAIDIVNCEYPTIVGNKWVSGVASVPYINLDLVSGGVIADCQFDVHFHSSHIVQVDDCDFLQIRDCSFFGGGSTTNTYDAVHLLGSSDDCVITGIICSQDGDTEQLRHAVNISVSTCDNNWVYANDGRGTASATNNDAGTGTVVDSIASR